MSSRAGSLPPVAWSPTAVVTRVGRLVSDYRVVLLVLLACRVATWLAHRALGSDPTRAEIDRLGYGLPALLDSRVWTLLIGMVLTQALTVPVPIFSLVGVVLYERVAGHRRSLAVLVGGQVLGVVVISALLFPVRNVDQDWLHGLAEAIDFGMSVGGFATLGAWTAYLSTSWRRRVRLGLSCYFVGPLLFEGLIYDLTHPAGWVAGLWLGARLRAAGAGDDPEGPRPGEWVGLAVAAVVGGVAGAIAGHQ